MSLGYIDPNAGGGSMVNFAYNTDPPGQGEPLNVIISGHSDKQVLVDTKKDGGFRNYMLAAYLGDECLGIHMGTLQIANLADGLGPVGEVGELRWNYGNVHLGSCQETILGGNHLRYWVQNTTGAYFLAVSDEMDVHTHHNIAVNGYNLGRDFLVGNVTGMEIPLDSKQVREGSTFAGQSSYGGYTYHTDVVYTAGLLRNTSDGINHYLTVKTADSEAIDGLVAVLTVRIVNTPEKKSSARAAVRRGRRWLVWLAIAAVVPSMLGHV